MMSRADGVQASWSPEPGRFLAPHSRPDPLIYTTFLVLLRSNFSVSSEVSPATLGANNP